MCCGVLLGHGGGVFFFATDEHGFSRMKRMGLCLVHERHEIHEKWWLWFCDFCSSGFPARDLSLEGLLVSGVFLSTEGTEVE